MSYAKENETREVKKKNKTKKGMVETNMEVAEINKQITIVRVG